MYLEKGQRITVEWMEVKLVSLAGVHMKLGGTMKTATGVITDIRGDRPTEPTTIDICILDDEGNKHWLDSTAINIKEFHNENA